MAEDHDVIDDSLYSRQRYVLGDSAMQRMAKSNVLLINIGGLGVEIAKNLVLAGVKSVTIQDGTTCGLSDLGTQFFIRESDVNSGANRAEASAGRVAELNPYVSVKTLTAPLNESSDLNYMSQYQCIVLTEVSLSVQLKVNAYCRLQNPQIKVIIADVCGLFCWAFCDFGDEFEVLDPNGEEPKEVFIASVTKSNPGMVTTLDGFIHGFESDDVVIFKEVEGMTALNNQEYKIQVTSPTTFAICDTTSDKFNDYKYGGIATQVKKTKISTFECLSEQLLRPSLTIADFSKFSAPANIHIGMLALHEFRSIHQRSPKPWCSDDWDVFVKLARNANMKMEDKVAELDEQLLRYLCFTSPGCFVPLCASLGGVVSQEVLKALTGKFTPLQQWLSLDATEILNGQDDFMSDFTLRNDRYDPLRICVGNDLCEKLANLKLFMIGCGAIGCELIKNYALLGVSTSANGKIVITDNDLIEKSNLNRQFLFRPHHIRMPKSSTAAESAKEINPELRIEAHQNKVWPHTEAQIYNDEFFESQDIIVNALDNVEARRYVDSRCVTNQTPLLESGTMGSKGHVQVVVPYLTESYSSQRDPPEQEVPYCTLKSFPANIEHCIQWARDKFESLLVQKPQLHTKFWSAQKPETVLQQLRDGQTIEGVVTASKVLYNRPQTWSDCVTIARLKFEKYFNHRAKNLLHIFPIDTKMQDGSLFWQSPKRPPCAVNFDPANHIHMMFVTACARLLADICVVKYSNQDLAMDKLVSILSAVKVPQFKPKMKKIETDENMSKTEPAPEESGDEIVESLMRIQTVIRDKPQALEKMFPVDFEKDDDSNGHIDFITAASNLRALMYNIEPADRFKTKRIAGRIVPAIATTTAAVSGLVTVELVKIMKGSPISDYKNCFMNLALPVFLFSEPGAAEKITMRCGITYTLWDRWDITGHKDFTIQQFIDGIKEKYNVMVDSVIHGVKMLYVPIIPGHRKRLGQPMIKFLKPTPGKRYVDLVVSFKAVDESSAEEKEGPPVRYFFGL